MKKVTIGNAEYKVIDPDFAEQSSAVVCRDLGFDPPPGLAIVRATCGHCHLPVWFRADSPVKPAKVHQSCLNRFLALREEK